MYFTFRRNAENFQPEVRFFQKIFDERRWTIAEALLARDGCHGITMTIIGQPGTIMTRDELEWNLSRGIKNQ